MSGENGAPERNDQPVNALVVLHRHHGARTDSQQGIEKPEDVSSG